jgi:pimeloyl-ACP methyl ester carboxylesterase
LLRRSTKDCQIRAANSDFWGLPTSPLETAALPPGIRSRFVDDINGLNVHILEAGFDTSGRPLVVMLHGFPEIAYSWRKVMPALAASGYHVVAPDQRGYGRTTGWSADYDADLRPYRLLNAVRDILGLVFALGYRRAAAVVGHDFGASVAAWCALLRPDVFGSLALMSASINSVAESKRAWIGASSSSVADPETVAASLSASAISRSAARNCEASSAKPHAADRQHPARSSSGFCWTHCSPALRSLIFRSIHARLWPKRRCP